MRARRILLPGSGVWGEAPQIPGWPAITSRSDGGYCWQAQTSRTNASDALLAEGPRCSHDDMVHTRALPVSGRAAARADAVEAALARLAAEVKAVSERLATGGSVTALQTPSAGPSA